VTAFLVADLGFGDAGKGTITDFLVRTRKAPLVVRYNGGAQAGHTVVAGDRTFTFAQLGSGTLVPGVRTHLSRFMVVHPTGLLVEAERLKSIGVNDALDRISISPDARVITPFHQAAGRLREIARGRARHGSCGVGVGETIQDAIEHPKDAIAIGELGQRALKKTLVRIRDRKRSEVEARRQVLAKSPGGEIELAVLDSNEIAERWLDAVKPFLERVKIVDDRTAIPTHGPVVFEGAHGVLLDEWRGFHPYTTWHTTTFEHAFELLRDHAEPISRVGVLRTYATRHGVGPFPTEDLAVDFPEPHNPSGAWQGAFRRGWLDMVLARYAIAACGGVDRLAITHLDRLEPDWQICTAYAGKPVDLGPPRDLAHQEHLGKSLLRVQPEYAAVPHEPDGFLAAIERSLEVPVWIASHGPRAEDKRERSA
jgi:adenylosuccinate synthase